MVSKFISQKSFPFIVYTYSIFVIGAAMKGIWAANGGLGQSVTRGQVARCESSFLGNAIPVLCEYRKITVVYFIQISLTS